MSVAAKAQAANQAGLRRNEQKWTRPLLASGWSLIPNVLLERQRVLQIDATDLNIILHLVKHWWFEGNLPHPSKQSIADNMGIDISTVRRRIAKMEKRGLLKRIPRNSRNYGQLTNEYDLSGLIVASKPLAEDMLKTREDRKKEDADRRIRRQSPHLKVRSGD